MKTRARAEPLVDRVRWRTPLAMPGLTVMRVSGFVFGRTMNTAPAHSSALKKLQSGFVGSLAADAVAMPVHWYYDTRALDRDYGTITDYQKPRNPHADSILWRSSYSPGGERGDILREQAAFWGQRGIHYHQFLNAGENTLNFKLARELYTWVVDRGGYKPAGWLGRYIECMLAPGWPRAELVKNPRWYSSTYVSRCQPPSQCGISDIHIGGLAQVPALCAALATCGITGEDALANAVSIHIRLTHRHERVVEAGKALARLLVKLSEGWELDRALSTVCTGWASLAQFKTLMGQPDRAVVGRVFSPACYIHDAFPAALYLAWRHQHDFSAAICANAMAGGDNCHRGAVVGSVLGAIHGAGAAWVRGLHPVPVAV